MRPLSDEGNFVANHGTSLRAGTGAFSSGHFGETVMTRVLKFVGTSALSGVAAFFLATATLSVPACDNPDPTDDEKLVCEEGVVGCCKKNKDCGSGTWTCTTQGQCIRICRNSGECTNAGDVCEDGVCRPPGCGNDDECGQGLQCLGGVCEPAVTASAVDSCVVLPEQGVLVEGAEKSFTVVAKDKTDKVVAYKGEVTWGAGDAKVAVTGGKATGGAESGKGSITAKIGSVDCEPASVLNYAAAPADKVRVTVIDLNDYAPVAGAKIVIDGAEPVETNAEGSIVVDGAAGEVRNITAFHKDYAWVTVYGTSKTDVVLYTRKGVDPAKFTGTMGPRAFDTLPDLKGTIHLAIHGSSIPGNVFDLELASILGETKDVSIDLGGSLKTKEPVPLPGGTVLGFGETMITGGKPDGFEITAPAGVRTLWGLGGNVDIADVTKSLGPVLEGGSKNIDIGPILTGLLPLLGKLHSGALTGMKGEPGGKVSIDVEGKSTLMLDTPLRLRANVTVPKLPTFKYMEGTEEETGLFEGAIVLGGALNGSQGLVPLGLTAGIDAEPKGASNGLVDAMPEAGIPEGKLALRMAPLHSGMETTKYAIVGLAASFGGLLGGGNSTSGPGLALSGLISYPAEGKLAYNDGKAVDITLGDAFLNVPNNPAIDNVARKLTAGSKVDTASFQRLSVGDAGAEWLVYFAPGDNVEVTLPEPPAGVGDDRLVATGSKQPSALLHSVRLGASSLTFEDVVGFNSSNMDDLTKEVDAFSVITVKR